MCGTAAGVCRGWNSRWFLAMRPDADAATPSVAAKVSWTGQCGTAGSREPILAVAQSLAGEMRRHSDRSSHAHKKPADGNGAITGDASLFLPR